jgi:hypothetical protein
MTKRQRKEIMELTADVWQMPEMKKILRAQLAASVAPGCGPLDQVITKELIASTSLELADEILRQAGL